MAENLTFKGIRTFSLSERGTVHIGVLRGSGPGEKTSYLGIHPLIDRVNSANRSGVRLIRPQVVEAVLTATPNGWKFFAEHGCLIFPTSAVVAYCPPDKFFDAEVRIAGLGGQLLYVYTGDNAATYGRVMLVAQEVTSADFSTHERNKTLMKAAMEQYIIPSISGYYTGGGVVPFARATNPRAPGVRYVFRDDSEKDFVGPLVRETGQDGDRIKMISIDCSPFESYGVVVEIPSFDVNKFFRGQR